MLTIVCGIICILKLALQTKVSDGILTGGIN